MQEGKKTSVVNLDELDKRIAEQTERLEERKAQEDQRSAQLEAELPWTTKMHESFRENILKSAKCSACNWLNTGQKLVMMNRIQVMREALPVVSIVCKQCGAQFVPKWCRQIMNQAIEKENRLLKERQLRRGQTDGETV